MFEWERFSDGTLDGMEAFIDDSFSIHIIKYSQGEGYHWFARSWDESGQCTVTGSYDFPKTADGFAFLSEAYQSAIEYMESKGVITASQSCESRTSSAIRAFLNKAAQIGFATIVSLNAFVGSAIPSIAYADEASPSYDVYIEYQDGQFAVYSNSEETSTGHIYFKVYSEGSFEVADVSDEAYDAIMSEVENGFPSASLHSSVQVGTSDGFSVQNVTKGLDEIYELSYDEKEFALQALEDIYHEYSRADSLQDVTLAVYSEDSDFMSVLQNNLNLPMSNLEFAARMFAPFAIIFVGALAIAVFADKRYNHYSS